MKKYTVIHKDGSKEIINAQCAVKDAMAEGNIVLDEDFDVVNPILLTPECDNKFALLSNGNTPYIISYHPNLEKGYAVNGYFFDCFGHTRGLPTNPVTEDIRVVSVLFDHTPKEVFMHLMDKLDSLDGNELVLTLNTLAKLLGKK